MLAAMLPALERRRRCPITIPGTAVIVTSEPTSLILLEPDVLEKVARYENSLERSLFRNLHELQKLQAARSGVAVTLPVALDVDLHLHRGDLLSGFVSQKSIQNNRSCPFPL